MLPPENAQVVTEQLGRAKPVNPSNQADALPACQGWSITNLEDSRTLGDLDENQNAAHALRFA
jgi:hypothetical protein